MSCCRERFDARETADERQALFGNDCHREMREARHGVHLDYFVVLQGGTSRADSIPKQPQDKAPLEITRPKNSD